MLSITACWETAGPSKGPVVHDEATVTAQQTAHGTGEALILLQ